MSTPSPPPPGDGAADASSSEPAAPRRGAHRAPAKPQRVLAYGVIAVSAVVALLVAFSSCGGGFDSGQGVINGTPGVTPTAPATTTTAPPTTTPPATTPGTTAPPTTTPPATTAAATTRPPTTRPATTRPPTAAAPTSGPRLVVDVLNGSTVTGLAQRSAAEVRAAGWTVGQVGNWRRTTVPTETIYYGPGDEGSARRLGRELSGDQRIAAALSGMSTTRLTLVVRP